MTNENNPLATARGTSNPKHEVVAVLHDPSRATQALGALKTEDFSDASAEMWPGPVFIRNSNDLRADRSLLEPAPGLFPAEEHVAVEEYLAEAERGASVVTDHAPERKQRDQARQTDETNGGGAMRHHGEHTITDPR